MKREVAQQEWWPVIDLREPDSDANWEIREVPDALVERFDRAKTEFKAVQVELRKVDPSWGNSHVEEW